MSTQKKTSLYYKTENAVPIHNTAMILNSRRILPGYASMNSEYKKYIFNELKSGKLIYGNIEPDIIIPYLKLNNSIISIIPPGNLIQYKLLSAYNNMMYLIKQLTKQVYNQEIVQDVIKSYIDAYFDNEEPLEIADDQQLENIHIKIKSYDDFPAIQIIYTQKTETNVRPLLAPTYTKSRWLTESEFIEEIYDNPSFYKLCSYHPIKGDNKNKYCCKTASKQFDKSFLYFRCDEHRTMNGNINEDIFNEITKLSATKVKVFYRDMTIIKVNYPLYGIEIVEPREFVETIYDMDPERYNSCYRDWNYSRAKTFCYLLYSNKLLSKVKYNTTSPISYFGVTNILNIPELISLLTKQHIEDIRISSYHTELDSFNRFVTYYNQKINYSGQLRIANYLKNLGKKSFIHKDIIDLLLYTEIEIGTIKEIYDNISKFPKELQNLLTSNTHINVVDPFLNMPQNLINDVFLHLAIPFDNNKSPVLQLQNLYEAMPEEVERYFTGDANTVHEELLLIRQSDREFIYRLAKIGKYKPEYINIVERKSFILFMLYITDFVEFGKNSFTSFPPRLIYYILRSRIYNERSFQDDIIIPVCNELKLNNYSELITWEILEKILLDGNIEKINIPEEALVRYELWKNLTDQQKVFIREGYSMDILTAKLFSYKDNVDVELENLILEYDGTNLKQLIEDIGMVVPVNMSQMDYFIQTLKQYSNFLNRGKNFDPLSRIKVMDDLVKLADLEICLNVIGGYPAHNNRSDLINVALRIINGGNVFLYLKPNYDEPQDKTYRDTFYFGAIPPNNNMYNMMYKFILNRKEMIISLSELKYLNTNVQFEENEMIRSNTIFLSYGDIVKDEPVKIQLPDNMMSEFASVINHSNMYYRNHILEGIDQDEFIVKNLKTKKAEAMNKNFINENGRLMYINRNLEILPTKLHELETTLVEDKYYYINACIDDFKQLVFLASEIELRLRANNERDRAYIQHFVKFNDKQRNLIVKALVQMFDAGMHQRQWKGKRGDYPMTRNSTGTEYTYEQNMGTSKEALVGTDLAMISEYINEMEQLAPNKTEQTIEIEEKLVGTLVDKKIKGKSVKVLKKRNGEEEIIDGEIIHRKEFTGKNKEVTVNKVKKYLKIYKGTQDNTNPAYFFLNLARMLPNLLGNPNTPWSTSQYMDNHNIVKDSTLEMLLKALGRGNISQDELNLSNTANQSLASEFSGAEGMCIRIGSSHMIFSAYYYLKLFSSVNVLGFFEFWKLESIS